MFIVRNPCFNLTQLIEEIMNIKFSDSGNMCSYLTGRAMWCASSCSECIMFPNEQTLNLKNQILDIAIETLKVDKIKSIKLISTRTINKYARKMKKESLLENAVKFEGILD